MTGYVAVVQMPNVRRCPSAWLARAKARYASVNASKSLVLRLAVGQLESASTDMVWMNLVICDRHRGRALSFPDVFAWSSRR